MRASGFFGHWAKFVMEKKTSGSSGLNTEDSMTLLEEIQNLIIEYTNPRNDGYVRKGIEKELEEIRDTIDKALEKDDGTPDRPKR